MNRLAGEFSPYLRQHADNPVDWYPWCEEALEQSRTQRRPILLSIGYSSCHWCHVMARESFEDPTTAAVLNEFFICVKVDREERPDLDHAYQLAHQILRGRAGGWPLTTFLEPDSLLPFFSATYLPRESTRGLPGLAELSERISSTYQQMSAQILKDTRQLARSLAEVERARRQPAGEAKQHDDKALRAGRGWFDRHFDSTEGGFGEVPKFPWPTNLERLLRHWARVRADRSAKPDRDALNMVMHTLTKMARGGIYDHLGGGFCRYATDRRWIVPHFEKMLFDNGALLGLYADALSLGPDVLFAGVLHETAGWMMRDMQHPGGGYYSAVDADSDGEEGAYYVWRRSDVKKLLTDDEYLLIETLYGLDKPANFKSQWILWRRDAWRGVVERLFLDADAAAELLATAKAKLFAARGKRTPPQRDEKVLAAWNGLAIHGMAKAAMRAGQADWLDSAARALDFARSRLVHDGRLHTTWIEAPGGAAREGDAAAASGEGAGSARIHGFLDDHVNLLRGALTLLEGRWRDADYDFALFLGDELLNRFEDADSGGFFFTAHDHERLIHRHKPVEDEALPAGNGIAASALLALGRLSGEARFLEAARRTLDWAAPLVADHPHLCGALLNALDESLHPHQLVIVRGPQEDAPAWLDAARQGYRPGRAVYAIPYDARRLPSYLPRLVSADTRARVSACFVDEGECSKPERDLEAFRAAFS